MSREKYFWPKVDKTRTCWLWKGGLFGTSGYGAFSNYPIANAVGAHRYSWELVNGKIPKGKWVLHKCNVKICVNPQHLYLGGGLENAADRVKAGTQPRGSKIGNSKLTEAQVSEIQKRVRWGNGYKLAKEYGVCPSLISAIKKGHWWKHV